jgi:chemotaxis protein histidine kinase CheA
MYLLEHLEPAAHRYAGALFRILVGATLVAAFTSCSGDNPGRGTKKGSSSAASSDAVEELAAEVTELLAQAEKAGVPDKALEKADKYRAQAEDALEDEETSKARKKYKIARKAVTKAIKAQQKVAKAIDELEVLRKAVVASKKKAQEANAATNAPDDLWKEAADLVKKAEAEVKNATAQSVRVARSSFDQARDLYEEAATAAIDNAAIRLQAESEKKVMADLKSKAKAKQADEKAAGEWLRAGQTERDAETFFASGKFRNAVETFKQATQSYQRALETVVQQEATAKYQAEFEARDKETRTQEEAARQKYLEDQRNRQADSDFDADDFDGGNDDAAAFDTGASIPLPEGFDAEICVQDLDAEDEEFLATHYKELTKSGILEYDPAAGAVRLDYTLGKDVKVDIQKRSIRNKAHISFKHFAQQRKDLGGTLKEQRDKSPFSFAGNTVGLVTFPVPFRCWARVDYFMQIQTMDNNGTFRHLLMFNAKKKSGFVAEWLRAGYMSGNSPKLSTRGLPRKFLGSANEWFDKTSDKGMRIEFRLGDPESKKDPSKSGLFSVTYDLGGDDEQENKIKSARYKHGLVGFQWNRVKFEVRELVVTGILDKQKAVSILRKKLGVKKAPKREIADEAKSKDPDKSADARKAKSQRKKDDFDF